MNILRFLILATFGAWAVSAPAQIAIRIEGVITSAPSPFTHVGDLVEYSQEIVFPLVDGLAGITDTQHTYKTQNTILKIGGVTYSQALTSPLQPPADIATAWGTYTAPRYGFFGGNAGYFTGGVYTFGVFFTTFNAALVSADGLPLPGVDLSQFDSSLSEVFFSDSVLNLWKVTSYSIVRPAAIGAVPEPSTYGFACAALLISAALWRRKHVRS